ncbi:GNAT family N-acetyltransferase [Algoriphagus halophilus]|uniref:Acetyltransferase (GNAT) family protein n=1 Tax=Algoriphagus halophilus TaxID=226505 RepID=A0A1N6HFT0_9BACT|nr:GNAT family N-acetyltransferase [Algoriphagus halophilus]SIO18630.1 Acetyltransferase (GNAT) family protein [Algoriphagus halophilus]
MKIVVREGSIEEIFQVHQGIPEFYEEVAIEFYKERLKGRIFLALVAEQNGELVGFKVGYQSQKPDVLYSWMGGVRPAFRKSGAATALADFQEVWATKNGFKKVFFKTRNRFPDMIKFGLGRDFKIVEVIRKDRVEDFRIVMVKKL